MKRSLLIILVFTGLVACHRRAIPGGSGTETGLASYYAESYNGKKTSSGERYSSEEYTAAHKKLPFGTKVKVTNLSNGKTVKVRINDRGPFVAGRIIDLTKAAAEKIDMLAAGVAKVRISY